MLHKLLTKGLQQLHGFLQFLLAQFGADMYRHSICKFHSYGHTGVQNDGPPISPTLRLHRQRFVTSRDTFRICCLSIEPTLGTYYTDPGILAPETVWPYHTGERKSYLRKHVLTLQVEQALLRSTVTTFELEYEPASLSSSRYVVRSAALRASMSLTVLFAMPPSLPLVMLPPLR